MFAQTDLLSFRLAMHAVPAGMFMNALFLGVWGTLPRHLPAWSPGLRLTVTLIASLILWTALALLLVVGLEEQVTLSTGIATTAALGGLGLLFTARTAAAPRGHNQVGPMVLISRGLAAAVAIAVAMVLASRGDDVAAGIAAVFPAIFLTTMMALWLGQGESVPSGAAGPMMVGSTSVATFALLATWTVPSFGPTWGTLVAWLMASGAQLPLFFIARAVLGRGRRDPKAG